RAATPDGIHFAAFLQEITMKRVYAIVLGLVLSGISISGHPAPVSPPPLPALTDPATNVRIPGKFIWADYFTSDVDAAKTFYSALFGWEWRDIITAPADRYGVFYQDGIAVAGVAYKPAQDSKRPYGRWVYYASVEDVPAAVKAIEARGGSTLLPARSYADRGAFAVVADPESALFGVMRSSSGDPADYQSGVGQWLWVGLYATDVVAATRFYQAVFGYQVHEPEPAYGVVEYVLSREGYARAGVLQVPPASGAHPTWVAYVRVNDVAQSTAAAIRLGGTALIAPDAAALNGDLAVVADPFGAPIGLIRWTYPDDQAATSGSEVKR
ncbi:MAG: VOC family protein, partial [Burkholderiaceae bacterium]|nr:VOC family protein [Burkholderiaceae bacterium]